MRNEPVYGLLADWMKAQRAKIDLSEDVLAMMLQMSPKALKSIESGKVRVLLHVYQQIRNLLDDEHLAETAKKARLFYNDLPKLPGEFSKAAMSDEDYRELGEKMKPLFATTSTRALADKFGVSHWIARRALQAAGVETSRKLPRQARTAKEGVRRVKAVK